MNQANLCSRAQRLSLRPFVIAFVACSATLFGHAAYAAAAITISGSPAGTVTVGSTYSFTPTAQDSHAGQTLAFAIANKPSWATFNGHTGQLSGTPTAANVGKYPDVAIQAYDTLGYVLLPTFGITVQASTSTSPAPTTSGLTISGSPPSTATVGSSYSFTPTAQDSHAGQTLAFAIANKPSWATFNGHTGQLSGTPTAANVGKYPDVAIQAYDTLGYVLLPTFGITVQASTSTSPAPTTSGLTISGSPPSTATVGSSYSFTPTAQDSHAGQTLAFAIANKPSWATFNGHTGQLSGTPTAANVGKYPDVAIQAYDALGYVLLPTFGITVQSSGAGTPTSTVKISGTPKTSDTAGSPYSFQPSATDSAGRTVSFSVANKPSWATFSIASGLLSGTPTTSQTGSYANITISASDGQSSSALPPFTITVGTTQAAATGSASLEWSDPTHNTSGSALTNLAGIHIYYGTSEAAMTNEVTIASTSETSYTISGLTAGTWYFGATAYTTAGMQSAMSSVGSKTIP